MFGIEHRIRKSCKKIKRRQAASWPLPEPQALTSPTHNSLLDLMLKDVPGAGVMPLESVALQPGELPLQGQVYFPCDALLTLAQVHPGHPAVDVAVVGRHACVGPSDLWASPMRATVIVAGQAQRLDWSWVQTSTDLYAPWLWHTTAATHGLIQQMAQTAFCVRHHSATQRLASWLLMCLAQHGGPSLSLPLSALPGSLAIDTDGASALLALEKQRAIMLQGDRMLVLQAERLAGVACRCHAMVRHSSAWRPPRPL